MSPAEKTTKPTAAATILEPEHLDLRSEDIAADKQAELVKLFPEVRTEGGKIDFDRLKLVLGQAVDVGKERYGMNWSGKAECFRTIQSPSLGTLRPCAEESINFDTTENLIIEGDNLEVLKLLQKSYPDKIKMIYIDPPYNTGGDFIYPDSFSESLQTYLEYTGQIDAEGKRFGTNTETDGRFHSKWLNMMYPRLYLARNLLREDGVLFVSIDDREVNNLRLLLNEIFGEENFLGLLVWHSKKGGGGDVKTVVAEHEYIVAYSRTNPEAAVGKQTVDAQPLNLADDKGHYRKGRELNKWGAGSARADRPTMFFAIPGPDGEEVYPIRNDGSEGRWRMGKPAMFRIVSAGNALFEKRPDGTYIVYEKIRSVEPRSKAFRTILTNAGTAAEGTAVLKDLFGGKSPFDFPKPPTLLRKLFEIAGVEGDDLVLDFFAGSGTTAHALLEQNRSTGSAARFVLIQLPEQIEGDFKTVADITKERVRRVIAKMQKETAEKLSMEDDNGTDNGFRVLKLAESNFRTWDAAVPHDSHLLERQLELHVDHLREGRTSEDILYELLIKSGFPPTTAVDKEQVAGQWVYAVAGGALMICLERTLTLELIRGIAELRPERVVCLDEGFAGNDQLKANAVQTFRTKGVTSFRTV